MSTRVSLASLRPCVWCGQPVGSLHIFLRLPVAVGGRTQLYLCSTGCLHGWAAQEQRAAYDLTLQAINAHWPCHTPS
ncbi:hypothetical protein [Terracidiphilus gabretensis]|uniref:hypothetical protein n=1 Tax=Terracidiphilus gabretensis TaxID=1577687 RepID=UPI0012F9B197|nr:hypothetical protein [Terracidiphilus gabretensis]